MTQILRIPKAAVSMREGTLVAWLTADGAVVQEGQPIFTLELEKSTMDVESPAAGAIKHFGLAGTKYKVGEIIGEIATVAGTTRVSEVSGNLQRVMQVVGRLEDGMSHWARSAGAGPFFVFPHMVLTGCEYRGAAVRPDVSMAIGCCGDTLVELVQTHDSTPSVWQDAGANNPIPVVLVEDFASVVAAQTAAGNVVCCSGSFQYGGRFAYVDLSGGGRLGLIEKHFVLTQLVEKFRAAHRAWDRSSLSATLK